MSRRPGRAAGAVVWLATAALTPASVRRRYRDEPLAELHGLSARRRSSIALGLLLHAGALTVAVNGAPQPVLVRARHRRVGCWTGVHHRWHLQFTDDNQRYLRCRLCGQDMDGAGRSVPNGLANQGMYNAY